MRYTPLLPQTKIALNARAVEGARREALVWFGLSLLKWVLSK